MAQQGSELHKRAVQIADVAPDPVAELLRHRRWRVLRAALPHGHGLDPVPGWVRTPEQFAGWVVGRLAPGARHAFFSELELIAKQTCDLNLLRLARNYKTKK